MMWISNPVFTRVSHLQLQVPLPATELIRTFADVTDAEVYLHFKPKTSLQEGLTSATVDIVRVL
jgi:hypothetical protein